jgi:hypothetical protein
MDFGLGELLRHFEEHFGKILTRILLGIVGLAVLGFSLHVIWQTLMYPAYKIILWGLTRTRFDMPNIRQITSAILSAIGSALLYLILIRLFSRWATGKLDALIGEAKNINKDARMEVEKAQEKIKADQLNFTEWYLSLDVIMAIKKENELRLKSGQRLIEFPKIITPKVLEKLSAIADSQTTMPLS